MRFDKFCEFVGGTTFGKGTVGIEVGQENRFVGTQNLVCFCHEVHAAHNNYIGIGLCGFLCQCKAVANKVGNVLNCSYGIEVRQNHGVLLFTHFSYFFGEVCSCGNRLVGISFLNPTLFYHITSVVLLRNKSMFIYSTCNITQYFSNLWRLMCRIYV